MTSALRRLPADKLGRRLNWRYPISLALQYQLLNRGGIFQTGVGRTVNISSSGVLFEADAVLTPGMHIELLVEWPARINNEVELNLWLKGKIVRTVGGLAAMTIAWHEYRTRAPTRLRIFGAETRRCAWTLRQLWSRRDRLNGLHPGNRSLPAPRDRLVSRS
jgi:PilZ domain